VTVIVHMNLLICVLYKDTDNSSDSLMWHG